MHAVAGPEKEFGLVERTEHHPELRAAERGIGATGIILVEQGCDVCGIVVAAQANCGPEPIGPAHGVFGKYTDAALADLVAADVGDEAAPKIIGQRQIDRIMARLQANRGLHRQPRKRAVQRARDVGAGHQAVIVLVELVAKHGIAKEIGEVVEEVELALHHIGVGFPRPHIVTLRDAGGEREAIGVAAVAWILRAEPVEQATRDRSLRHLISRIPFVRIGHAGDGYAIRRGTLAVANETVELADIVGIVPRPIIGADLAGDEQRAVANLR
ncbi:hypothetical protein ACVIN2_005917 [Bradyrhizobium sp. USDA 3650]